MTAPWRDRLIAWLHDPPDKALGIRGHGRRAQRYVTVALGDMVSESELAGHHADQVAAAIERLPFPAWQAGPEVVVGPGEVRCNHPLSGDEASEDVFADDRLLEVGESAVHGAIGELVADVEAIRDRFLFLWRLLPQRLAEVHWSYAHLPADTRVPDHTIWQHLDTTAAMDAAVADGHGGAILVFSIGPVQSYIATARSVRDLWTGSMILSWLAFRAMAPVLDELGPPAVVYPALRGSPLLDLWLRRHCRPIERVPLPGLASRLAPCLPNRFVALVPWGPDGDTARRFADACVASAHNSWKQLAGAVRSRLDDALLDIDPDWARWWDHQVDGYFDVRAAVLPVRGTDDDTLAHLVTGKAGFDGAFPKAAAVRRLAEAIPQDQRPSYGQSTAGQWQHRLELAVRSLEAQKALRRVPAVAPAREGGRVPPQCSLCGSREQMGPADLDKSRMFWDEAARKVRIGGVRLRASERLCAVGLVKRFAGPAFFVEELALGNPGSLRVDDMATIAAASWLEQARHRGYDWLDPDRCREQHGRWSGQWLHAAKRPGEGEDDPCPEEIWVQIARARQRDQLGAPPAYYAILMMDGDHMGKWLRGDLAPPVSRILHPKLRGYYESLPGAAEGLEARRPVSPGLHAAISQALANFALHFVPQVVRRCGGTLIYAGGDDVLALVPTSTVLDCAAQLNRRFRSNWAQDGKGRTYLLMGPRASLSAGVAVVHYKEDLRFALQVARRAERQAKAAGRDALQMAACRRSGEHASALCPWEFVETLVGWVNAFRPADQAAGASDRWAYALRRELGTLRALPEEAMGAEIRRLVDRAEEGTRKRLGQSPDRSAGEVVAGQFREYRRVCAGGPDRPARFESGGDALEHFVTLCQTASFLARGKDT